MDPENPAKEDGPRTDRFRLLLVDDERDNLELLGRALRETYDVTSFDSAAAAFSSLYRGEKFDLALVDNRMPHMSGLELLARLKQSHPRMMRLILTAYTDTDDLLNAINDGEVYRYITKPWDSRELLTTIRQALERYQLERDRDNLLEELARANHALNETNQRLDEQISQRTQQLEDVLGTLNSRDSEFDLAVYGANDGLWHWDIDQQRLRVSPRWAAMLGYAHDEIGTDPKEWIDRVHPIDRDGLQADIRAHLDGTTTHLECEHRLLHKDGSYRWVICRGMAIGTSGKRTTRLAGSMTDVTTRGFIDRLTGLPVRSLLLDRLQTTLLRSRRRPEHHFAVTALDIDRFKLVNEDHGRNIGDELLRQVGNRLKELTRVADTVAHCGADQFAILLEDIADVSDSMRVADRVRASLAEPFRVFDETLSPTFSMGVAVNVSGYDHATDMLQDAETARRQAHEHGGNCTMVFDPEVSARSMARLQTEVELRQALEQDQFRVFLQPVIDLESGRIVGAEALVRWQHPQRGLVPPGAFIPIAEETGLITEIDRWMLYEACEKLRQIVGDQPSSTAFHVNVNVSGRQLHQHRLLEEVADALQATELPPYLLTLEITETALIRDIAASEDILSQLKRLGVQISLDDFGTGYSSLSYLHRFPVDSVKIDCSFVREMDTDANTQKIIQAIITLAKSLGKKTTAEGVERPEHLDSLRHMKCSHAQGYLFSKPVPFDEFRTLLASNPAW